MSINLDGDLQNADWTKQTPDFDEYTPEEFVDWLRWRGTSVEEFKRLPVYRHNHAYFDRLLSGAQPPPEGE